MEDHSTKRYIGDKPKVIHINEPTNLLTEDQAELEDGDHLRTDEQGWE
jgi:hypothetical protein